MDFAILPWIQKYLAFKAKQKEGKKIEWRDDKEEKEEEEVSFGLGESGRSVFLHETFTSYWVYNAGPTPNVGTRMKKRSNIAKTKTI